jgi:hypothetical protein
MFMDNYNKFKEETPIFVGTNITLFGPDYPILP